MTPQYYCPWIVIVPFLNFADTNSVLQCNRWFASHIDMKLWKITNRKTISENRIPFLHDGKIYVANIASESDFLLDGIRLKILFSNTLNKPIGHYVITVYNEPKRKQCKNPITLLYKTLLEYVKSRNLELFTQLSWDTEHETYYVVTSALNTLRGLLLS